MPVQSESMLHNSVQSGIIVRHFLSSRYSQLRNVLIRKSKAKLPEAYAAKSTPIHQWHENIRNPSHDLYKVKNTPQNKVRTTTRYEIAHIWLVAAHGALSHGD